MHRLRRRYGRAHGFDRPGKRHRATAVPIAEAAVTGPDGFVYAARTYGEWSTGTYSGASDLTDYFVRVGREWHPIGWTSMPKSAYRQLRARLKNSRALRHGRTVIGA